MSYALLLCIFRFFFLMTYTHVVYIHKYRTVCHYSHSYNTTLMPCPIAFSPNKVRILFVHAYIHIYIYGRMLQKMKIEFFYRKIFIEQSECLYTPLSRVFYIIFVCVQKAVRKHSH